MKTDQDPNDQQADEVDDEQSDKDQADDEGTGVEKDADSDEEADDDATDDDADDEESDELITDEKFDALKSDPAALRKELQAAATKKFQRASEMRKAVEPYAGFINAYERDPKAAAIALVKQLGVSIEEPTSKAAGEKAVKKVGDVVRERLTKTLGTGYEDLATGIAEAVEEAAKLVVAEELKSVKEGQDSLIKDAAGREANEAVKVFSKVHPDYKDHEKEMVALTKKFPPNEGVTEAEYLEAIYTLATAEKKTGDKVKKVIDKMTKSVKGAEGKSRTVTDKTVSKGPSGRNPTFGEAAAAAERGERFD